MPRTRKCSSGKVDASSALLSTFNFTLTLFLATTIQLIHFHLFNGVLFSSQPQSTSGPPYHNQIHSMKDSKNVLIFKAISDDLGDKDPYVNILVGKGYNVQTIPVLEFKFRNLILLKEKLDCPERYGGIIFSNPRCVQAVADAVGDELPEEWRKLPAFAVGDTTARQINDLLQLNTEGTTSSNVATLTSTIVKKRSLKPLLLPSGNVNLDTIERLLNKQGVATDIIEVYTTVPHPAVEENLKAALEESIPKYVVYFSPSGVHTSHPILKEAVELTETKWISIGPTTGAAIESYGIKVSSAASRPTPECLLTAIEESDRSHLLGTRINPWPLYAPTPIQSSPSGWTASLRSQTSSASFID